MTLPTDVHYNLSLCHFFVSSQEQNLQLFEDYHRRTLKRLKKGEDVAFCLHSQTFSCSCGSKRIQIIQLAEVKDMTFLTSGEVDEDTKAELEEGLILLSPFTEDMIKKLSELLSHNNAYLITFDIFSEIPLFLNEGIKLKMNRIYDGNYTNRKGMDTFNSIVILPVNYANFKFCDEKISKTEETKEFLNQNKIKYNLFNVDNPFEVLNVSFWPLFSRNCAFILLALFTSIEEYSLDEIYKSSMEKIKALNKVSEKFGNLAPFFKRHYIINKKSFSKGPKNIYRTWTTLRTALDNFDIYNKVSLKNEGITKRDLQNQLKNAEKKIIQRLAHKRNKSDDDSDETDASSTPVKDDGSDDDASSTSAKNAKADNKKSPIKDAKADNKKAPEKNDSDDDASSTSAKNAKAGNKKSPIKNAKADNKKAPEKDDSDDDDDASSTSAKNAKADNKKSSIKNAKADNKKSPIKNAKADNKKAPEKDDSDDDASLK